MGGSDQILPACMVATSLLFPTHDLYAHDSVAPESDASPKEKVLRIFRTDTPPILDGALDDAAWLQAAMINDMHQFEPLDHGEPSER